ncbi:tRNA pseudouridine(38-40) synthase TruA [bacterium]|nr:tRNA pseudouridine(38-40) synthase TruA [bacterium]
MKCKIVLEYDGSKFSGWQFQPGERTVQGELESALLVIAKALAKKRGEIFEQKINVQGSGRTDSGVHALAQVASFTWPDFLSQDLLQFERSLDAITPREIAIKSLEQVADDFDARFAPHIKAYRYTYLLRNGSTGFYENRAWLVRNQLKIAKMCHAARLFTGKHDFRSFRALDCSSQTTERTILRSECFRLSAEELVYEVEGKGFLKHMVRTIAGALLAVGKGDLDEGDLQAMLDGAPRRQIIQTAPAHGLCMQWVKYGRDPHEK